ncbi:hypothetical protein AGMMS49965_17310 [Bacteroidia bacterium]|nr:hypothetical protein AGMMS49965_17310 [Bacteroidia bacterium]
MLHYFNPGHEEAVLNGSHHFQPPANHVRMQRELAFLPVWYASADDFVLVHEPLPADLEGGLATELATAIRMDELAANASRLAHQTVALWGISPQSCHFLKQLSDKHQLHWTIPEWKDEYRTLGSRQTAHTVLSRLIEAIPDIDCALLPQFISDFDTIEQIMLKTTHKMLIKAPYSSSGRGLVWLPPGKMAQSERQILKGMLRKQSCVSLERALDKQLDFSMHFETTPAKTTAFIGYSLFQTNAKGAYEHSLLLPQDTIKQRLTAMISNELLEKVKHHLLQIITQIYAPHYQGNIGVDMLIYAAGNRLHLHPCVEINMRKSMGYLALRLFEGFLPPNFQGEFHVGYDKENGRYRAYIVSS